MKKRVLIVVATLLLAVAGLTVAQQQTVTPPSHRGGTNEHVSPPHTGEAFSQRTYSPSPVPTSPVVKELKPEDLTIEQLIEAMEKTRDEIAEREKKNKAMLKVLQDKVSKLKVRMDSFSGKSEPPAIPVPAPVADLIPPRSNQ